MTSVSNLNQKRAAEVAANAKKMNDNSVEASIIATANGMCDAFKRACREFNATREMLAAFKDSVFKCANSAPEIVANLRSARGIDIGATVESLYGCDSPLDAAEDAEKFTALLTRLNETTNPISLMRACTRTRIGINASIERWESKRRKMQDTLDRIGESNPQSATYRAKIQAFDEMVSALRIRRATIETIFCEAKRKILQFVEHETARFGAKAKKPKKMKLND